MKKLVAVLLAGVLALGAFAGCGGEKSSVESIKKSGKLVMTTNAAFPPFEYVSDGDKVVGVDADIAQAIADELGVELQIDNVTFDGALTAISTGKADIAAAGITVTEERKQNMDFSDTYATSVQYVITKKGVTVNNIEDLKGKKMGVQMGTTGDLILTDEINGYQDDAGNNVEGVLQGSGAEVIQYKSALEAALDMNNGNLDAVVIDKLPAENIVAVNDNMTCTELVYADGSSTQEEYAIAVQKGNQELLDVINDVLKKLDEEGKIDEFILEHTGAAKVQ